VESVESVDTSSIPAVPQSARNFAKPDHARREAAEVLFPQVYEELRALARRRMAEERSSHTLQATALVHEAYLRLVGNDSAASPRWAGRAHFFHAAAEAMRRILIDHARSRATLKRGGSGEAARLVSTSSTPPAYATGTTTSPRVSTRRVAQRVAFNVLELIADPAKDPSEIIALDDAILRLEQQEPHLAAIVRLRFYAGLSLDETAEALGVSPRSVKRDWAFAKAWLFRRLGEPAQT
jgi:RNA polymerase sigma factor (sigma-70 family)